MDLFTCLYTTVEGRRSGVYIYAMYPAIEPDVAYKVPCNSSPPSNKAFFFSWQKLEKLTAVFYQQIQQMVGTCLLH